MEFEFAPDVQGKVERIIRVLQLNYINEYRIFCMRSKGSKTNAYARIWNLPRIWQKALGVNTYYIIEVISENYDVLNEEEREKVLIHELLHIPKTFSGALVPHVCFGKKIDERRVNELYKRYKSSNE